MWMIPFVLAALLLVPAAVLAASTSHDAATGEPGRLERWGHAVRERHR
jgi:hypothetical protein